MYNASVVLSVLQNESGPKKEAVIWNQPNKIQTACKKPSHSSSGVAMRIPIKICGITKTEDAQLCESLGAWALGFVFAKSPRAISIEKATLISDKLSNDTRKVGVFVDPGFDFVSSCVEKARLTMVQLYGPEKRSRDLALHLKCKFPNLKVIRALFSLPESPIHTESPYDYYLFDKPKGDQPALASEPQEVNQDVIGSLGLPCWVAGGLNQDNVAKVIKSLKPFGVDVASGVESTPGSKDSNKLRSFFTAARETQA